MAEAKAASDELAKELLEQMGYKDSQECCRKCEHFEEADMSGSLDDKPARCTLNAAVWVKVEEQGRCDHFTKGEAK